MHQILTKVCLLVSDNGFSQIFCNCLNLDEILNLSTIEHLVCCKMGKNFANRLSNKKVLVKNIFE